MASTHQILCINKSDRLNPQERINRIGGRNGDGSIWQLSIDEAITGIEKGKWRFYVSVGTHTVWVSVAVRNGRKYLKTENDGDSPDNLLSLPECI